MRRIALALMVLVFHVKHVEAQGTLNIALTQQFSFVGCSNVGNLTPCGFPLIGGLLYFYQAGSSIRQNSFSDTGLTQVNQWPLVLDGNGRVPMFYLANGNIRARLTDAQGVVQFDNASMVVLGPAPPPTTGGGGTVDPTAIMSTGDIKWRPQEDVLDGWVRLNGRTIGNAASGATERAADDAQPLYVYLWNNFTNTKCPVLGGRGPNAASDFAANKPLTVLDMRGRIEVGRDNMSGGAAGRILSSNIASTPDTVDTGGATGGEANHQLTIGEMPSHDHGGQTGTGIIKYKPNVGNITAGAGDFVETITPTDTSNITVPHLDISAAGGDQAHNNMQPFMLGTFYIKL